MAVITSMVIKQTNARPKPSPEEIMKNSINKKSDVSEELGGNATEKRGKEKAIDDEYEYDDYYDVPIIEIKFKRETTKEEVENTFKSLKKNLMRKPKLLKRFRHWSYEQ